MGQINTRDIVLLASATVTTSGTGNDINLPQAFQAGTIIVGVNTVSGTSPTLDVYLQRKVPQAAATDLIGNPPTGTGIYDDVMHFSTLTTTTTAQIGNLVTCGAPASANATLFTTNSNWAQQDAAIASGAMRIGPIGGIWRIKYVVGGTSPSFAITGIVAQLLPFST